MPLHLLREHRDEISRHLDQVVLVCRSGNRAAQAEAVLAETGMTQPAPARRWHPGLAGRRCPTRARPALTNTCLMGNLLSRLPFNRATSCDVDTVVRQLTDAATVRR